VSQVHQWPESHSDETDVLRPVEPPAGDPSWVQASQPGPDETEVLVPVTPPPTDGSDHATSEARQRALRRAGVIAGSVFGVLVVLYGLDLLISSGDVPRGVTVAGVEIGGLSHQEAEQTLQREIEPRLNRPIRLKVGDAESNLDPAQSGLQLDWKATLDRAGSQPLNPITRFVSMFTSYEVGVATSTDDTALGAAVEELRAKTNREPAEGGIRFEGRTPVAVEPVTGQQLDIERAPQMIIDGWANGTPVDLPVTTTPVKTTSDGVRAALEQIAKPAVSGPVIVHGEGKDAALKPEAIAAALIFEPADGGGLNARLDQPKVVEAVQPQLASTEKEGKDAAIVFDGGQPIVQPSEDGVTINWDTSFAGLMDVLKSTSGREVKAQYAKKPAKVTTEQANQLGIKEVIGEFTTGGFAPDSGQNIRTVAQKVSGAIVKPGETFSLNGFTGPRTAAQGYVEAGVIKDGAPGREVGGGISQFATTLYNAAYFAAMKDAGHKEHSYYISRYPVAREATVFQSPTGASLIDLKFTNDSPTGVAIQASWTPSSITVKLWGTKRYNVESISGPRTEPVQPQEKPGPPENCVPTNGIAGFTSSDTRVIRDAATGQEIRRSTRTVRYNAQPKIICPPPPPPA
jgi:vancomycin resistance protein YoaR